ncbi:hypothetical protein [Dactylosporangium salmoneum]|uniref:Uncharacterized protein n=1 Tax=Dactylosporangium salmoneum TaxID=53361 RepID=A0ABN3I7C2_9ACTN
MSDDHGDEYDEDGEAPPAKGSWRILIVSGIVAALVLISAAVVIGFELRAANQVSADTSAEAGPAPSLGPDVRAVRSECPKCIHSIAVVDGMSWADRLPQKVTLSPDSRDTTAQGERPNATTVHGELQLDNARVSVTAHYVDTWLLGAECQLRAVGDAPLTQTGLDFLKGCVTAAIPDSEPDLLSATRDWVEARFRPADTRQPQIGWVCGQVAVDFLLDRRGADVVISGRELPFNEANPTDVVIPDGCQEHQA